jgi:hypothetical protein
VARRLHGALSVALLIACTPPILRGGTLLLCRSRIRQNSGVVGTFTARILREFGYARRGRRPD